MKKNLKIITTLLLGGLFFQSTVTAETHEYAAITDFPILDAGEVPFYADLGGARDVLAINASIEDNRNRFARAELNFAGTPGIYDITLTTLGELDGDCIYQLIVNGVVQGTVINLPAGTDYEVQEHQFENVSIPAGAVIGVSAVALSNGTIPEGDAYAFARGRWRTLTLTSDDAAHGQSGFADLSLSLEADDTQALVGDTIFYSLVAQNLDPIETATSPVISVSLPDALSFIASDSCQAVNQEVICSLPELTPGASESVTFNTRINSGGAITVVADLNAPQIDLNILNNVVAVTTNIDESEPQTGAATKSGSGAISYFWLLLLLPVLRRKS